MIILLESTITENRFNIQHCKMLELLAQRGVEWEPTSGKWEKNWDDGRLSPGNPRFGFGTGHLPGSGKDTGTEYWDKKDLDDMLNQVLSKLGSAFEVARDNHIQPRTLRLYLWRMGFKFVSRKTGWAKGIN